MKLLFGCAATVLAAVAVPGAQAATSGSASCGVTHHDCYPACVQFTPDGSDCAKTRQVCKDICGSKPAYPAISNTERADVQRFEAQPYRSGNTTILPSNSEPLPSVSEPLSDPMPSPQTPMPAEPSQEDPYPTSPPNP